MRTFDKGEPKEAPALNSARPTPLLSKNTRCCFISAASSATPFQDERADSTRHSSGLKKASGWTRAAAVMAGLEQRHRNIQQMRVHAPTRLACGANLRPGRQLLALDTQKLHAIQTRTSTPVFSHDLGAGWRPAR